jgi:hypothetical protein
VAMAEWERYCLSLRPLRPFGFSEFSEQLSDGKVFNSGSSGIEDEAEGRPEEDLVRLMQGDELTDAEKNHILGVGSFFEEAIRRKRESYQQFWSAMPESEQIWFNYADPPAYDPARNRIATLRRVSQDHVVVLFEQETEAGWPSDRGYHLRPVDGHWRIVSVVNYQEEFCRLVPPPAQSFDQDARVAAAHPNAAAIAKAREMMTILESDPLLEALDTHGDDLFAALEAVGAYFERDDDGVCTHLSLAQTAVTDAGMVPLAALTGLQELTLGPKTTDAGMVHLAGMTELMELRFGDGLNKPRIEGSGLAHLDAMHRLERLDLGYLPLTDAGMAHLKGPSSLRELLIYHTKISDAGLISLAHLPNLEELHGHETQIRGPGLVHLTAPSRLKVLIVYETPVDDAGLEHLKNLTGLEELSLESTRVTDAGLRHLAALTSLKGLVLPEDGITASGRAWLSTALPNCQIS